MIETRVCDCVAAEGLYDSQGDGRDGRRTVQIDNLLIVTAKVGCPYCKGSGIRAEMYPLWFAKDGHFYKLDEHNRVWTRPNCISDWELAEGLKSYYALADRVRDIDSYACIPSSSGVGQGGSDPNLGHLSGGIRRP